jgi:hypothetical protein
MRDEFPSEPTWLNQATSKVYQSLDRVYLDMDRQLIRSDEDSFEKLVAKCQDINVSKLLAVDYVVHMLLHVSDDKLQSAAEWLCQTPTAWGIRLVVERYFEYHAASADSQSVLKLVEKWKAGTTPNTQTKKIVDDLIGPTVRMQVFRISDGTAGLDINKFIGAARKEFGLLDKFELLADFKDLEIKKEMTRDWWENFQHGKCQHLIGANKVPCKCLKYGSPDKVRLAWLHSNHASSVFLVFLTPLLPPDLAVLRCTTVKSCST